ncbi:hypothetical protein [Desertivirga arenae]|uniref:hypothetical protein n=1 Tax=Desertivirga arenae TaxID=2810309 RepID=UPI001A956CCF|nr:hypothetical protein [Pedobacter sp. SYSU D00823]
MFRLTFSILLAAALLSSCTKDNNNPLVDNEEKLSINKYSYKSLNVMVDSLQYNNPMQLDLNGDGFIDYVLSSVLLENNDLPYLYLYINRKSPNQNRIIVRQGEELPLNALWGVPLEKDFVVQENLSSGLLWSLDQYKTALLNVSETSNSRTFGGEWLGKKEKFLGLQFYIEGKKHYGWLRISHNLNQAKLAIQDYAYNKIAGQPIKAGEK